MKIGLWNIDHPETQSGGNKKETRFNDITEYLIKAECDACKLSSYQVDNHYKKKY